MSNITIDVILHPSDELKALLAGIPNAAPAVVIPPISIEPRKVVATSEQQVVAPPAEVAPPAVPVTLPAAPTQPTAAAPAVPTTERTYTLDELGRAGAQLMDAGKGNEALALFGKFGISDLTGLAAEQYGAFATELRALGAKI